MIRVGINVYVETDDARSALDKLQGAFDSLNDMYYYEQGAVVNWEFTAQQISPASASGARLERQRKLKEAAQSEED